MDIQTLKEYIRIHTISLEQDLSNLEGFDRLMLEGAIDVSKHYLEVANDN
jgi:hypothetical protein